MALRRLISKRHFAAVNRNTLPPVTFVNEKPPFPRSSVAESSDFAACSGLFRRFLPRRAINSQPSFLTLSPVDHLREKLKTTLYGGSTGSGLPSIDFPGDRLHLEVLQPPPEEEKDVQFSLDEEDARKLLRFMQLEKARRRLRSIPATTITYRELVRICGDERGNSEVGPELAKALDDSGNVIVLGGVVFLHPAQVAQSVERVIKECTALPGDPRRDELAQLEKKKAQIDEKAQSLVQRELYFGLGLLVLQTLGFMRLTFWELTWDVMEPICFFTASFHFFLAYAFFLKTSKEPSFEGFFHSRFKLKQNKLMRIHNFDLKRYNHLREAIYPAVELQ